jgi:Papain-like cysteine protease AvrRpt2
MDALRARRTFELGSRAWRRRGALFTVALIIAACQNPRPSVTENADPGPAETPASTGDAPEPTQGALPIESPRPAASIGQTTGLLLSEVGFAHGTDTAFVELWNAGSAPVDLRDAGLALDGSILGFTAPEDLLAPGTRYLLRFDLVLGEEPPAGLAHLMPAQGPKVSGGSLDLLDALGRPIDHVAWGEAPDPVRTGLSGVVPDALEPQWTIGRAPGQDGPDERLAWVPYTAPEASPGVANPLPGVPVVMPLGGAIFHSPRADLSWYPVPGATGYRVQVATDAAFSNVVHDESVARVRVSVDGLLPGSYFWHVQATGAGELTSTYTTPATFEVDAAAAGLTLAIARPGGTHVVLAAVEADANKKLRVDQIYQHKDTDMLQLERNVPTGEPHPWDQDHGALDETDPSDNMNCVLASIAMISAFACPTCHMSEDRIGYEVFKGELPGPEHDLNYGDGTAWNKIQPAQDFALVAANSGYVEADVPDRIWGLARAQIDAGKPLMVIRPNGGGGSHATVVTGYDVKNGKRTLFANDPWNGPVEYAIATSSVSSPNDWWRMYPVTGPLLGRQQELSVADDTDGDGVVDFDETERFHTNPNEADTDDDGVGDKQDIFSSVFDPTYGYAVHYRVGTAFPRMDGRDFDRDNKAPELDPDSDNGGCKDGDEDKNLNGIHDAVEAWNFDASDDPCQPLNGGLRWTESYVVGSPESWQRITDSFDVNVRIKPDPEDPVRLYLDDGSTYSYTIRSSSYVKGIAGCDMHSDGHGSSSGAFAPGDLQASKLIEYEPGQDALAIVVSAPVTVQGRYWDCLTDQSSSGDSPFRGDDFCYGLEVPTPGKPGHAFRFDCGENIDAGWFGRTWHLTGMVVLN